MRTEDFICEAEKAGIHFVKEDFITHRKAEYHGVFIYLIPQYGQTLLIIFDKESNTKADPPLSLEKINNFIEALDYIEQGLAAIEKGAQ